MKAKNLQKYSETLIKEFTMKIDRRIVIGCNFQKRSTQKGVTNRAFYSRRSEISDFELLFSLTSQCIAIRGQYLQKYCELSQDSVLLTIFISSQTPFVAKKRNTQNRRIEKTNINLWE